MLRKTAAAAFAFGLISAGAYAAEHEVTILDGAFFPEITYVQPGDTVVIENASETPRTVFGDTFHFVTPSLNTGDQFVLTVTEDMPTNYFGTSATEGTVGEGGATAEQEADTDEEGNVMHGMLSFDAPVLED